MQLAKANPGIGMAKSAVPDQSRVNGCFRAVQSESCRSGQDRTATVSAARPATRLDFSLFRHLQRIVDLDA
jgi:hypothetical protein